MKQSIQIIIKIVIFSLNLFVLVLCFLPVSSEIPNAILFPETNNKKTDKDDVIIPVIKYSDPADIAVLFGWIKPRPTAPPVVLTPTATPLPAVLQPGWLKFSGKVTLDGIQYYIFKDERYTSIIQIAKGKPVKGWTFNRETNEGYFLSKDGQEYFVAK